VPSNNERVEKVLICKVLGHAAAVNKIYTLMLWISGILNSAFDF